MDIWKGKHVDKADQFKILFPRTSDKKLSEYLGYLQHILLYFVFLGMMFPHILDIVGMVLLLL